MYPHAVTEPRSVEIPFGHIALLLGWATFPTSRGVIFCVNVVPAPRYHLAEPPQVAGGYNVPSYTQLGAVPAGTLTDNYALNAHTML